MLATKFKTQPGCKRVNAPIKGATSKAKQQKAA